MRCARRMQALDDADWHPATEEDQLRHRHHDRLRASAACRALPKPRSLLKERGPRKVSPFFIPGRLINLASGLCLDRARPQGAEPCGGDGLLDRRACDRRCGAADRARRCRRDGGGRHGIADLPASAMAGFCACARAVDRLQRHARKGLAPLRQGPRRLRDGRGRRHRRARGIRARQGARREDLCRGDRLRPVGRRLSHHRAGARTAMARSAA